MRVSYPSYLSCRRSETRQGVLPHPNYMSYPCLLGHHLGVG